MLLLKTATPVAGACYDNHTNRPFNAVGVAPKSEWALEVPMETTEERFLMTTLEFWQKRTKRKLSLEDAREIAQNACAFFEILMNAESDLQRLSHNMRGVS